MIGPHWMPSLAKLREAADLLDEYTEYKLTHGCEFYAPYPKQVDFHNAGSEYSERLLGAGNQLGKTLAGSMECAFHATGDYPDWWEGTRFDRPTVQWVCGVSGEVIRDTTQRLLLGRVQDVDTIGTGSIPRNNIAHMQRAMGVPFLLDHVKVLHTKSKKYSLIFFKSYEKGRAKFQGETIDHIWFDEEPPEDIYTEGTTRTNKGKNGRSSMMTFTPLLGMTNLAFGFYKEPGKYRHLTMMSIQDVTHYTQAEKDQIIESYPEHEREARVQGIPMIGSGAIFPVADSAIRCDPFEIPKHWARVNCIDFGYDHPQGANQLVWDRDADVVYVVKEYRKRETTPAVAAITLRKWGDYPWAWPHDGYQHDKGSGLQLADQYKTEGLNFHREHSTHSEGGFGTEAGIMEMLDRMQSQRLKVFSTCTQWFEEKQLYHRKDGKIVKLRDDLMSATRMGIMMLRIAASEHEMMMSSGTTRVKRSI